MPPPLPAVGGGGVPPQLAAARAELGTEEERRNGGRNGGQTAERRRNGGNGGDVGRTCPPHPRGQAAAEGYKRAAVPRRGKGAGDTDDRRSWRDWRDDGGTEEAWRDDRRDGETTERRREHAPPPACPRPRWLSHSI